MLNNSLKKIVKQPFRLSEAKELQFSEHQETLHQQLERDFITVLPGQGLVTVSGAEAGKFLQGQLTCDIDDVDGTQTSLGLHCTPQGRAIASFRVCQNDTQQYSFIMPRDTINLLQDSLARYIVFSKATIDDRSNDHIIIGISGNSADELIKNQFATLPETTNAQAGNEGALCVRVPGDKPRYELCLPIKQAAHFWEQASNSCQVADSAAWQLQDIRAGLASISTHTTEMFIPQMLDFDRVGAISFSKGCYTGQEIIARAHYRGAVKRRLHHFTCLTPTLPDTNQQVFIDGKQVGTLITWVQPDKGKLEGLMVLQEGTRAPVHISSNSDTTLVATPCHDEIS
jgi:folate-binding protein YgfZ